MSHVDIDGRSLRPTDVAAVAGAGAVVRLADGARQRAAESCRTALEVAARRPAYGRTTGVGANRSVTVADDDDHGLRLLRSHAGGAGGWLPREDVRAMLVVRLNQLAAGGAGVSPELLDLLVKALNQDTMPTIHAYGAVGTGDLTALAETALTLAGERPWDGEPLPPFPFPASDALAFMSSNAATLGRAALAHQRLAGLADSALIVAALSLLAAGGNLEAFAPQVAAVTPQPGASAVAQRLRDLLTGWDHASRIQDPFGFRALPQVHGPVQDALQRLHDVVEAFINATAENPLVDVPGQDVVHHAGFHTAYVAGELDTVRLSCAQAANLGLARLSHLLDPQITGLTAFLATGPAGSSGLMILEYTAAAALGRVRHLAHPVAPQTVALSLGTEEHASFSTLAADLALETVEPYTILIAAELVAAVRALRMHDRRPAGEMLSRAYERVTAALGDSTADRDLAPDLAAAIALVDELPTIIAEPGTQGDVRPPGTW